MCTVTDVKIGACSAHAIGIDETQTSFASTGLDTSARSMQHGELGVCTGWLRPCCALRVAQHVPVATLDAEAEVETSWHSTPVRVAEGDANALTMQKLLPNRNNNNANTVESGGTGFKRERFMSISVIGPRPASREHGVCSPLRRLWQERAVTTKKNLRRNARTSSRTGVRCSSAMRNSQASTAGWRTPAPCLRFVAGGDWR